MKPKCLSQTIAVLLTVLMLWSNSALAAGSILDLPGEREKASIAKAIDYLHAVQNDDGGFPAEKGGKSSPAVTAWVMMALAAAGEDITSQEWAPARQNPVDYLCSNPNLEKLNDYSRTLLALSAAGQGTVLQGTDLAEKIASWQQSNGQFAQPGEEGLVNGHMWAVIALTSAHYALKDPEGARAWLLARQNEDGGFGWAEASGSDPDDTGVAIQTMILLGEDPATSPAVKKALAYLRNNQQNDGGLGWQGSTNCASDAWALQGVIAAGENPLAPAWQVNGRSLVDHLLSLQNPDGSFNWMKGVSSSPVLMTAYCLTALSGRPFPVNLAYGAKGHNLLRFSDLSPDYWAYQPILSLVEAGVLKGYPDGTFQPEKQVTRAEFTKFLVCGLRLQGLGGDNSVSFQDVPPGHWASAFILIAANHGYIKGRTATAFAPEEKITGAEMATMLVRALPAASQSGVEAGPYWYSQSVELARRNGLLFPDFDPARQVTRAQCAYSIAKLRELRQNNAE